MKTVILDLDNYLSWRSPAVDLSLYVKNGDTTVATISCNGHDADAVYLNVGDEIRILAGSWYTIETLGTRSEIKFNLDNFEEIIASLDWKPLPRRSGSVTH